VAENEADARVPRSEPGLTRRRLLKRGLATSALLGAGGLFAYQRSGYRLEATVARRLEVLGVKEYCVLRAAASRLLRSEDGAAPSPDELGVALWIDGFLSRQTPWVQSDVSLLLNAFEHAGPLLDFEFSRFSRAHPEQQDRLLRSWSRSRLPPRKQGFHALKGLCVMAYYRHPESWHHLGYDGPLIQGPARGG
jgi:hypothetical protein